ncbi:MAG: hypothetical protein M3460_30465 [Actinomycetota bacterium]|nr:hypothetical protein [Actinomycetota bacterium]
MSDQTRLDVGSEIVLLLLQRVHDGAITRLDGSTSTTGSGSGTRQRAPRSMPWSRWDGLS